MKKQWMFLFFLPAFAGLLLLTVCRALPERNYLGMTRNEVASVLDKEAFRSRWAGIFLLFGSRPIGSAKQPPERLSYDPEEHKAFFDTEWVAFSGQKDRRVWVSGSAVDVVAKKLLRLRPAECFTAPENEMFPFAVRFTSADGKMTEVLLNARHFSFDGRSDRKKCFSHDITGEEQEAFYVTVEAALETMGPEEEEPR